MKFMFHVTDKITLNYQRTERSCGVVVVVASTISTSLESSAALDMLLVLLVGMYATIFLFLLLMHNECVVRGIGTETVEWSLLVVLPCQNLYSYKVGNTVLVQSQVRASPVSLWSIIHTPAASDGSK